MKLAVPDLISNSYFPAAAAVELGFFRGEGLEVSLELIFPVDAAYRALAEGRIDFVAGSAHAALAAFPEFDGVKLICAQAQGMYWFLVMRADLNARRGDLAVVRGRRIGAAPWVEMGLRRLLAAAGIDPERDRVRIMPVPGTSGSTVNFGLNAARALEEGATDGLIGTRPEAAAAAVRAIVKTQQALKRDLGRAAEVGRRLFPPAAAELIADIIRRDLPHYDARISRDVIAGMKQFCRDIGILKGDPPYEQIVATQFADYWRPADAVM